MRDEDETENGAPGQTDFGYLTPYAITHAIEDALDVRATSLCRPLASYINRVYDVELENGDAVIAKFYRPNRWDEEAILDELDFLEELADDNINVIPPLVSRDGTILHYLENIGFVLFEKRGGRPLDEPKGEELAQVGRLIGRMHAVGAQHKAGNRIVMHPQHSMRTHLHYILESDVVPYQLTHTYRDLVEEMVDELTPLFNQVERQRIHGDCHHGNILDHPETGKWLLDFDDMANGPVIQDLWLLLPDRLPAARKEWESLLSGYEIFCDLPRNQLRLIEPLRAMRYIHYTAWCARQKADGTYSSLDADWGSPNFWQQEIASLQTQRIEIADSLGQ